MTVSISEPPTLVSREFPPVFDRTILTLSIFEAGQPKVIENAEGARTTPSYVAFTKGELYIPRLL
jgi:hypothetical protein